MNSVMEVLYDVPVGLWVTLYFVLGYLIGVVSMALSETGEKYDGWFILVVCLAVGPLLAVAWVLLKAAEGLAFCLREVCGVNK